MLYHPLILKGFFWHTVCIYNCMEKKTSWLIYRKEALELRIGPYWTQKYIALREKGLSKETAIKKIGNKTRPGVGGYHGHESEG